MCRNRNALHRVSRDELIDRSTYRSRDRNVRRESDEKDRELVGVGVSSASFLFRDGIAKPRNAPMRIIAAVKWPPSFGLRLLLESAGRYRSLVRWISASRNASCGKQRMTMAVRFHASRCSSRPTVKDPRHLVSTSIPSTSIPFFVSFSPKRIAHLRIFDSPLRSRWRFG